MLDAYLLRAMALAGWAPALAECAVCGTPGRHRRVLRTGRRRGLPGLPAARRGPPGAGHARPDDRADRAATGGSPTPADAASRRECSGLVAAHLQWHLERGATLAAAGRPLRGRERHRRESDVATRPGDARDPDPSERPAEPPTPHPSGARPPALPAEALPKHVAIVMDGNGRWAKERGLPRTKGHEQGEYSLFDTIEGAIELGIPYLSAYAFSTENWKRSPEEVRFLMGFNRDVIRRRRDQLVDLGVRVVWSGRRRAAVEERDLRAADGRGDVPATTRR